MSHQDETYTWVFVRGAEHLTLRRETPTRLVATGAATARNFEFRTRAELLEFQLGFEKSLIATGWSLESFSPERRSGQDRRRVPRDTERRVLMFPPARFAPVKT